MAQQVQQDHKEEEVTKEVLDPVVLQDIQDIKDHKDHKVMKVLQDPKDIEVPKVTKEIRVLKD